jgi:antitoxin component YwqK of YwqJK toxin-antitoxin module
MKTGISLFIILLLFALSSGCSNRSNKRSSSQGADSTNLSNAPDTGYTGVTQYFSSGRLVKEVTLKNGIRDGLMKTYNASGQLYQTFWYVNGMRQDTAIWYFEDGKIFRKTPFKDDSVNGTQIQYYRSGAVKAKINFVNGIRTPDLEEFESNGKKITNYPDLVIKTKDEYNQTGTFKIYLELNKKNVKANYYKGEYIDGLFYPKRYIKLNNTETTGYLQLKKSTTAGNNYAGVIAEILTPFGNRKLVYKRIDLPNNNLK